MADTVNLNIDLKDTDLKKINDAVKKLDDMQAEWNDYLDRKIASISQESLTFENSQKKIDFLRERSFYLNEDERESFVSTLKEKVNDIDTEKKKLKEISEKILKEQQELINSNKEAIANCKAQINKKLEEDREIEAKTNEELQKVEEEIAQNTNLKEELEKNIESEKAEQEAIIDENDKDKEIIDELTARNEKLEFIINSIKEKDVKNVDSKDEENELLENQNEIKELSDKVDSRKETISSKNTTISDLEGKLNSVVLNLNNSNTKKTEKQNELNNVKDRINTNLARKENLNNKEVENNKSQKDLTIKKDELEEKFRNTGMQLHKPLADRTIDKNIGGNGNVQQQVQGGTNKSNNLPALKDTEMTKEDAKKMYADFMNPKTFSKQKEYMSDNYSTMVSMLGKLGIVGRHNMKRYIKAMRAELPTPNKEEFVNKIGEMLKDENLADQCFAGLFDAKGIARDIKSMKKEEINSIHKVIYKINNNRNEIGKNNPELLKYFDSNVTEFLKCDNLIETARHGKALKFATTVAKTGTQTQRDMLSNVTKDSVNTQVNEKAGQEQYKNEFLDKLTNTVKKDNVPPRQPNPRPQTPPKGKSSR